MLVSITFYENHYVKNTTDDAIQHEVISCSFAGSITKLFHDDVDVSLLTSHFIIDNKIGSVSWLTVGATWHVGRAAGH